MPVCKSKLALMVLAGSVFQLSIAIFARPPIVGPVLAEIDEPVDQATAAQGPGLGNYFTGFEPEEGFIPRDPDFPTSGFSGWINGQPWNPIPQLNWGITGNATRSDREGHIDVLFPYSGQQHLRISHDPILAQRPCGGAGCPFVDARIPASAHVIAQPSSPYRIELQMAISELGGQNFRIQPQSNTQGLLSTSVLFFYTGSIYVLDDVCGSQSLSFVPTGILWDASGAYQSMSINLDPCTNTVEYSYGGQLIHLSCVYAGTALEQFLVFGDNYLGSHLDLDDMILIRNEPCCGNGVIDGHLGEQCESANDDLCPGHCQEDCRCGGPRGACCDANGSDQGCASNVIEGLCAEADEVWFEGLTCAEIACDCVPLCSGRQCGPDGCGGVCGECDDGNVCNGQESCNETQGQCLVGVELPCLDGNLCNGTETCDPLLGCLPGTPLVCSDGNACNGVETCHPIEGCRPGTVPSCDDGLFCNGTEFCYEPFGCAAGPPPCAAGEVCDEATDQCTRPAIPAASAWGLAALALTLLIAAKVRFKRFA